MCRLPIGGFWLPWVLPAQQAPLELLEQLELLELLAHLALQEQLVLPAQQAPLGSQGQPVQPEALVVQVQLAPRVQQEQPATLQVRQVPQA